MRLAFTWIDGAASKQSNISVEDIRAAIVSGSELCKMHGKPVSDKAGQVLTS
jgi:hypothetical protein